MNCTTPANYFHALRRQIHRDFRKPLIIMTPKSLLRNKRCVSSIEDFTRKNTFHRVLQDHAELKEYGLIKLKKDKEIKKVVLCSGKVYFDLLDGREKIKKQSGIFYSDRTIVSIPGKNFSKGFKKI